MLVHAVEPGDPIPVVVCSHDCEIENPRDRAGLLVAPLMPTPGWAPEDSRWPWLISCGQPDESGAWQFIQFFPVELGLGGAVPVLMLADFSRIISAGTGPKGKARLLKDKVAEMTDETRDRFKQKIAAFFARP